jgi:hypothetical protein
VMAPAARINARAIPGRMKTLPETPTPGTV